MCADLLPPSDSSRVFIFAKHFLKRFVFLSYGFGRMPRAEMGLIGGLQNVEGLDPITHQAMANNMFAPSKLDRLLEKVEVF